MLSLTFLGTSAARPTVERSVSSIVVAREGETLMFDCGEGTQRQMMRYGVGFALSEIFFTHFHADHYLGLIGLVRTLALQGHTDPIYLYGPRGAEQHLGALLEIGVERTTFPVKIRELDVGERLSRSGSAGTTWRWWESSTDELPWVTRCVSMNAWAGSILTRRDNWEYPRDRFGGVFTAVSPLSSTMGV
jgi:ribonuclease BN (tRNA processing enzyme)